jgi:hypothetical protein
MGASRRRRSPLFAQRSVTGMCKREQPDNSHSSTICCGFQTEGGLETKCLYGLAGAMGEKALITMRAFRDSRLSFRGVFMSGILIASQSNMSEPPSAYKRLTLGMNSRRDRPLPRTTSANIVPSVRSQR